ncbi:hypothetical protein GGR52DRAFT_523617, partial [Hypoxylon sp. FL1284]
MCRTRRLHHGIFAFHPLLSTYTFSTYIYTRCLYSTDILSTHSHLIRSSYTYFFHTHTILNKPRTLGIPLKKKATMVC